MSGIDLPERIPIFPLPGALLLPGGRLPLHIFEDRYRAMARDALASDRLIGMIQPRDPDTAEEAQAPIYETGCVGRIEDERSADDGRYYFTLVGLCRFRVTEELPVHDGYRRVRADYAPFVDDLAPDGARVPAQSGMDRDALIATLRRYLDTRGLAADWDVVAETSDADLVAVLAQTCPFEANEKQALLEAESLAERCAVMTAVMEMTLAGGTGDMPMSVRH
ncbi:MAG: peptidase S16 [Rhodospirillaceae bacterium]|nr:peptidase S16 [Rhodospirillaceae bacterium]MBT6117766.1 peptidase S16 [Rhodospirillaceae bacterium]